MRLLFVTPRFRVEGAAPPELLAAELAGRAPGGWKPTVLTTTQAGGSQEPFRDGEIQEERTRVVRFPTEAPSPPESGDKAGAGELASPALLGYLGERLDDYDLVVLFGSSPLCCEAAKLDPERTVLLPFVEGEAGTPEGLEIFDYPAAFIFGSEAEEVQVLKRHQVHRRMRETIAGNLLLPRTSDAAAFRGRIGLTGPYLIGGGPLEPGRGVEELLRFFCTFKARHPDAALELVLFGPAALPVPKRPDIRIAHASSTRDRLDAVGGALMALIPERLAAFSAAAAEPFSLGVPILVNASATELADECRASGGGLYYQNYDEFELIVELGLRDPSLFGRMGAAGRAFLQSRHDWDRVLERYDRAFRSFARPSRGGSVEVPATDPTESRETPDLPDPSELADAVASPAADGDHGELPPELPDDAEAEAIPVTTPPEDSPQPAMEASPESEAAEPDESSAAEFEEGSEVETAPEVTPEDIPAPDPPDASSIPEDARGEDGEKAEEPGLPSFFRSSIRD